MATKVGTAYVDVVANFKPLNNQLSHLNKVSARLSASFRKSMATVSRDAARAQRPVAGLSAEMARFGVVSTASTARATAGLGRMEGAYRRNIKLVQRLIDEQRTLSRAIANTNTLTPVAVGGRGVPTRRGPDPLSLPQLFKTLAPPNGSMVGGGPKEEILMNRLYDTVLGAGVDTVRGGGLRGIDPRKPSSWSKAGKALRLFSRALPAAGTVATLGEWGWRGAHGDWSPFTKRFDAINEGLMEEPWSASSGSAGAVKRFLEVELQELGIIDGPESGNDMATRLGVEFLERFGKGLEKGARGKNLKRLTNIRGVLRKNLFESRAAGADDAHLAPMRRVARDTESKIARVAMPRAKTYAGIGQLNRGDVLRMKDINRKLRENQQQINQGWVRNSKQWRSATAQNMKAGAKAVKAGFNASLIHGGVHKKKMEALFRRMKLVQGKDPWDIAKSFKTSWGGAKNINNKQVADVVRLLRLMPKGAQKETQAALMQMTRGMAKHRELSKTSVARLGSALNTNFGSINRKATKNVFAFVGNMGESFRGLAGNVFSFIGNIGTNLNSALSAVKGAVVKFVLQAPSGRQKKQSGGFIVPGRGEGDSFSTSLASGSFVLNKKATKAFGFQSGGSVPVMLEPGERVFGPREVRRHGLGTLHALNSSVPRFAEGGRIPDQRLVGPEGPLRELGQRGMNRVDRAAEKYLAKHLLPRRVAKMLAFANRESAKGYDYVYGGGHGTLGVGPYDCSGFVSGILGAGGFVSTPMTVAQGAGLYVLGEAGAGKFFTWGVRGSSGENAHTMMAIKGPKGRWNYFEAGGGGGAGRRSGWNGGFSFRHMPGFQRGGAVGGRIPAKASEAFARFGQAASDPRSPHFVGWGFQGGGSINYTWPGATWPSEKSKWSNLPTLPGYVLAALAEAAGEYTGTGMPGWTMYQITKGEGVGKPGSMGDDDGDGSPDGYGWLAITRPYGGSYGVGKMGGYGEMLNPVKNAYVAARMYGDRGLAPWHGDQYVTNSNLHYTGKYDIKKSLDGMSFGEALGNPSGGPGKTGPSRKEQVEARVAELAREVASAKEDPVKKSNLWKLLRYLGGQADFDSDAKGHILRAVRRAASLGDEAQMVDALSNVATFAKNKGEIGSKRPEGAESFVGAIGDAQEKGREARKKVIKKQKDRVKGLRKALAERTAFGTLVDQIKLLRAAADKGETVTGEIIALEPQYMTEDYLARERNAYSDNLGALAKWRNAVIGARAFALAEIGKFKSQIEAIKALEIHEAVAGDSLVAPKPDGPVADAVVAPSGKKKKKGKAFGGLIEHLLKGGVAPGKGKQGALGGAQKAVNPLGQAKVAAGKDPDAYDRQKFRIPLLEKAIEDAEAMRDGVWLEELQEISPFSIDEMFADLPREPVAGAFGGRVFEVQDAMRRLSLGDGPGDTPLVEMLKEELRLSNLRLAVSGYQSGVLDTAFGSGTFQSGGVVGVMPPYAGKAHTGAIVPGPPDQERTMVVRSGEGIFTREQMAALGPGRGGGGVEVQILGDIVSAHPDPVQVMIGDRRFEAEVKRINRRQAPSGAPNRLPAGVLRRA